MTDPEDIAELFGIFHDGSIARGTRVGHATELVVEIEYLAERIRPSDRSFTIRMDDLEKLRFTPWADEGQPEIPAVTDFAEITRLDLGILSAEADGTRVKIACTQDRRHPDYCGGLLEMTVGECRVFDESGCEWSLEELRKLSDGYWSEWAARNKNAPSPP